jgi:hypothetical protein
MNYLEKSNIRIINDILENVFQRDFGVLRLLFAGTGLLLDELGADDARMLLIFAAGR